MLQTAYEALRNVDGKLPMDKGSVEANLDSPFCPSCCEIECDGHICSWFVVPTIVDTLMKLEKTNEQDLRERIAKDIEAEKCTSDDWKDCVGVNGEHCDVLDKAIKVVLGETNE